MIQFRFRFSSGATIHGDGWAIDDVCFEEVGGDPQKCRNLARIGIPTSGNSTCTLTLRKMN
ncbi:MAG: hypothetical protein U5L96_04070 [Owenweeksia sp.]|nr:hypothetical protein [Owenweeksia sp.]